MPSAASPIVSGFGTRRVRRSIAAPSPVPAMIVTSARKSDGLANLLPENVVDGVTERADADHRDDHDERGEQAVLDEILAVLLGEQAPDGRRQLCHEHVL